MTHSTEPDLDSSPTEADDTIEVSYWKIAPGRGAEHWPSFRREGYVAIGWDALGDLRGLDRAEFEARMRDAMANHPGSYKRGGMEQVWRFAHIPVGSRVVANRGLSAVLGIGTVTGPYHYAAGSPLPHRLPVCWDDVTERVFERPGWIRALVQIKKSEFEEILAAPKVGQARATARSAKQAVGDRLNFDGLVARLANDQLRFPETLVASYLLALQARRFVILSGISGTGKTLLAIGVARAFDASAPRHESSEEWFRLTLTADGAKRARFILPSSFVQRVPGGIDALMEPKRVMMRWPGGASSQAIWKVPTANSVFVLPSGDAKRWFAETFEEGDDLYLRFDDTPPGEAITLNISPEPPSVGTLRRSWAVIAVRPDWTDNRGLLGYLNPITRTYQITPALRLLLDAAREHARALKQGHPPRPFFLVLDEMNLARVEHYFSDFLSCMESGEPLHLHDDPGVEEGEVGEPVPRQLSLPPNLFVTGTINVDETTYVFSPKVLDRSFALEFNEVNLLSLSVRSEEDDDSSDDDDLRLERFAGTLEVRDKPDARDWRAIESLGGGHIQGALLALHEELRRHNRHFGYRVANEMARFIALAAAQGGPDESVLWAALDVAVLSKVLPKLHGTQQELESTLRTLVTFCAKGRAGRAEPALPRSAAKLGRMLERLTQQGFASFVE